MSVLIPENAILVFDNHRMAHARPAYQDPGRRLTRYWLDAPASGSSMV